MNSDEYREYDADDVDDPFVLDGLAALDTYLSRVAAFEAWVAEHGEPKPLGPDQIDPYSVEYQQQAAEHRAARLKMRDEARAEADAEQARLDEATRRYYDDADE